MSRPAFRQTAGVVLAVVALLLGITAAAALGWEQGKGDGHAHGKKEDTSGTDTGKKPTETTPTKKPTETTPSKTETTPPPTQTTPPTVTTLAPPPTVTTTATTPPETVTTQLRPPKRTSPPTETTTTGKTPPSETTTTGKTPPIRQVAKRKKLAATGLSPVLMVLLGTGLLGGGGFLLRRSL